MSKYHNINQANIVNLNLKLIILILQQLIMNLNHLMKPLILAIKIIMNLFSFHNKEFILNNILPFNYFHNKYNIQ